jgi:putative phage-type endonuclease
MLTDKQKEERKSGIGGSDAAAICGLSKWKTPLDIYNDKLSTIENNRDDYKEYIYFGSMLEPFIADEYALRTGKKIEVSDGLKRHKDYPWMIANVDRLIDGGKGILECKTAGAFTSKIWGESYSDDFPDEYLLQCAHYAIVCDPEYVDLAVLIGGQTFRIYHYKRNPNLEEKLIIKEKEFWENHILKQVPPNPINNEDASLLWEESNGQSIVITQEMRDVIDRLASVKGEIHGAIKEKEQLELELKKFIQDKEGITDSFGKFLVTWKNKNTNRFDVTGFKEKNPDLYNQFLKTTTSRVLRVKGSKYE